MKKKLLSLVLAGAMVASTSVSAFADTTEEKTYVIDSVGKEHQVDITGNVTNGRNEVVPGTISVTVPTAVSFTINSTGEISGGEITIKNTSEDKVEVVAKKFTDTDPDAGIVLVNGDTALADQVQHDGDSKVHASIKLVGRAKTLGLVSNKSDSETGFVDSEGHKAEVGPSTTLGQAWKDNPLTLRLEGKTKADIADQSYAAPTKALKNTFNLVLKIQKAPKNS